MFVVYVSGVTEETTKEELHAIFGQFGAIKSVDIHALKASIIPYRT